MRIVTLFPPLVPACFRGPHLAPPLLTALLNQEAELNAFYVDLNIRSVYKLLFEVFPLVSEQVQAQRPGSYTRNLLRHIERLCASGRIHAELELVRTYLSLASAHYLCQANTLSKKLELVSETGAGSPAFGFYADVLLENVAIETTDAVLLSVAFAEQLEAALVFAKVIKEQCAAAVFVGGSQITLLEQEQLEQLAALRLFDRICCGYYESELPALLKEQAAGGAAGIRHAKAVSREALQKLPTVRFNREELRLYFSPLELPVLATKGCYWGKCTFCDYAKMAAYCAPDYLVRDAKRIFKEIVALRLRYPEANIVLISDGISPALYLQLCRLAIKNNITLNTWSYMLHSDLLTESVFASFKQAGVAFIDFGSESTCDRILALMRKPAERKTILNNFALAQKYGIAAAMNIIIDFPTITYAECRQVLEDMRALLPVVSSFNPQLFHLSSNTPVHNLSEALQIIPDGDYCDTGHGLQCREFTTASGLSSAERDKVVADIGAICLEQRLKRRTSKIRAFPENGQRYACYYDQGAFTYVIGTQIFLTIPSLLLEVAISTALADIVHAMQSVVNPFYCCIIDTEKTGCSCSGQELYLSADMMTALVELGLFLYVKLIP